MRREEKWETSRKRLVDDLKKEGVIRSTSVEEAMNSVKRELFVTDPMKGGSYWDRPLPIGEGQTISAPHMVSIMAEALEVLPGHKVLEIGSGSGYHAAVVSRLVVPDGRVFSIERIPGLVRFARRNLSDAGIENVTLIEGDGSMGYSDEAPYDRIYYTCASPDVPDLVLDQLSEGGLLLGVIGPKGGIQRLVRYRKEKGDFSTENLTHCVFVPLIGELGY